MKMIEKENVLVSLPAFLWLQKKCVWLLAQQREIR